MSKKDVQLIEKLTDHSSRLRSNGFFTAAAIMSKAANRLKQIIREQGKEIEL